MRKRWKTLLRIALVGVILLVLLIVGLKIFFPVERAKQLAIEKGEAALGRPLTIESVDVSVWGGIGVVLEGVVVQSQEGFEPREFFVAENVDVKLRLLPLLTGTVAIDRFILNNPSVAMVTLPDGTNNFTFDTVDDQVPPDMQGKLPPEAQTAAAAISFDRMEVRGGTVVYDDMESELTVKAHQLELSTSLKPENGTAYHARGQLLVEQLEVATPDPMSPFTIGLTYDFTFDVATRQLSLAESELAINGVRLQLKGNADLASTLTAHMSVESSDLKVSDALALLPEAQRESMSTFEVDGRFDVTADIRYDDNLETALSYDGMLDVTDLSLVVADVPGELRLNRASVDFETTGARLNIADGSFDGQPLRGHLVVENYEEPTLSGDLTGSLDLAFVHPFLDAEQGHEMSGVMDFSLQFVGEASDYAAIELSGSVRVADGTYRSSLLPEPVESFSVDLFFDDSVTRVRSLNARTASSSIEFSGRFEQLIPYVLADSVAAPALQPTIDGDLHARLDLAPLSRLLPPQGAPQVAGLVNMDMHVTGIITQLTSFDPNGTIDIQRASYTDSLLAEPVTQLDARMIVTRDTIVVEQFDARFVSSDVSITGKLVKPFPHLLPIEGIDKSRYARSFMLFDLSSRRFDIDKLFPEAVPGSADNRATASVDSVSPFILPDIDGRGVVLVDTVVYSGVEFTDLSTKVKISDRKIECYEATAMVYSGSVSGSTMIDLNDFEEPVYAGKFQASQIEADDFVRRFSKLGGHVFGKFDLKGDYRAVGWDSDAFLNGLTMDGDVNMRDGKLVTSGSAQQAISGLAKLFNEPVSEEHTLKNLSTAIRVEDGRVGLSDLTTRLGDLGDLTLGGYYTFSGGLDYDGSILLSKSRTQQLLKQEGLLGGLAGLFSDSSVDRLRLPIKLGGTIDKPQFSVDLDQIGEVAGDKLKDKAGKLLDGLFKKK